MAVLDITDSLDRHQMRRDRLLPTVSVLVGPAGLGVREGRRWAEVRGRPVVEVAGHRLDPMADAWVDELATGRNLVRDAISRLARPVGEDVGDLESRISRMSPAELDLFFDAARSGREDDGAEAACRWILERSAAGESVAAPGLAARLGAAMECRSGGSPSERALAALGELIPAGLGPVLLVSRRPGGSGSPNWIEEAVRSLARLAQIQPRLSAILAIEPGDLDSYIRRAPESRDKALIRAGTVVVPGLAGDEIGRSLDASPPGADLEQAGPIGEPAGLDASAPSEPMADDHARSAAERFLFERLESLPETAGLFELNAALDIPFGPGRLMEVDLASRVLGLAIEIDGYYHFQDEDAYRRDRRKDVLLQARGYLVVRVLAEDVVRRLEDVLDLILGAAASRRAKSLSGNFSSKGQGVMNDDR